MGAGIERYDELAEGSNLATFKDGDLGAGLELEVSLAALSDMLACDVFAYQKYR